MKKIGSKHLPQELKDGFLAQLKKDGVYDISDGEASPCSSYVDGNCLDRPGERCDMCQEQGKEVIK